MEFAGPAPMGPFATLAAEMPLRRVNDVKQVEPGAKTGDTRGDTAGNAGRAHDNSARTAEARDITALRREMERRDLPAGPPPSFKVSQLEIASDIQAVIARVEAARSQAREADALKLEAETEERLGEAEVTRLSEAKASQAADAAAGEAEAAATGVANSASTPQPVGADAAVHALDAHL